MHQIGSTTKILEIEIMHCIEIKFHFKQSFHTSETLILQNVKEF